MIVTIAKLSSFGFLDNMAVGLSEDSPFFFLNLDISGKAKYPAIGKSNARYIA